MEEVRSWGQSFDKLMNSPAGRNAFREFLRTEFSEENMLFWLACEDLKKETNKTVVEDKVRLIYEDYVSILSPKEVCVLTFYTAYFPPLSGKVILQLQEIAVSSLPPDINHFFASLE